MFNKKDLTMDIIMGLSGVETKDSTKKEIGKIELIFQIKNLINLFKKDDQEND